MTDTGRGPVQHGGIKLLGNFAGHLHKILALLRIAGLHHGDLGSAGIVTVILLILRRMAAGVIGSNNDVRAVHAHVTGSEQRVGRHIQAHHLHGADGTGACHGRAIGYLGSHLFIGCPLAVHILFVLGHVLQDLGAGSSGVSGTDLDPGFVYATGSGFVTGHQMLHKISPPFTNISSLLLKLL